MTKRQYLVAKLQKGWSPLDVRDAILEVRIPRTPKDVLTAIVSHREKSGTVHAGHRRIAYLVGCDKDSVGPAIQKLVELGLLKMAPGRTESDPYVYDLEGLPARLVELLSVSESAGHAVSESTGRRCRKLLDTSEASGVGISPPTCPKPPDTNLSESAGQKQVENKQVSKQVLLHASVKPTAPAEVSQQFSLTPVDPPVPPKSREPTAHQIVKAHYLRIFEAKRRKLPFFDGAEGSAVKRLLEKTNGNPDVACMIVTNAFASTRSTTWPTILDIAKDPSRFLTVEPARTAGKSGPVQSESNPRVEYDDALDEPAKPALRAAGVTR